MGGTRRGPPAWRTPDAAPRHARTCACDLTRRQTKHARSDLLRATKSAGSLCLRGPMPCVHERHAVHACGACAHTHTHTCRTYPCALARLPPAPCAPCLLPLLADDLGGRCSSAMQEPVSGHGCLSLVVVAAKTWGGRRRLQLPIPPPPPPPLLPPFLSSCTARCPTDWPAPKHRGPCTRRRARRMRPRP